MKTRCNNPRQKEYANYGGRGIKVCERWISFANFLQDMEPTWRSGLTLDRIDTNGNYCPENCRWTTNREQQSNRRNTRVVEYLGEKRTLREWAEVLEIKHSTLKGRYYNTGERNLANCLRS